MWPFPAAFRTIFHLHLPHTSLCPPLVTSGAPGCPHWAHPHLLLAYLTLGFSWTWVQPLWFGAFHLWPLFAGRSPAQKVTKIAFSFTPSSWASTSGPPGTHTYKHTSCPHENSTHALTWQLKSQVIWSLFCIPHGEINGLGFSCLPSPLQCKNLGLGWPLLLACLLHKNLMNNYFKYIYKWW